MMILLLLQMSSDHQYKPLDESTAAADVAATKDENEKKGCTRYAYECVCFFVCLLIISLSQRTLTILDNCTNLYVCEIFRINSAEIISAMFNDFAAKFHSFATPVSYAAPQLRVLRALNTAFCCL